MKREGSSEEEEGLFIPFHSLLQMEISRRHLEGVIVL
jgi:hypothetical protein